MIIIYTIYIIKQWNTKKNEKLKIYHLFSMFQLSRCNIFFIDKTCFIPLTLYPDKFLYAGNSLMVQNNMTCILNVSLANPSNTSTHYSHKNFKSSINGLR